MVYYGIAYSIQYMIYKFVPGFIVNSLTYIGRSIHHLVLYLVSSI